jgi:serine O-acetyltransferase
VIIGSKTRIGQRAYILQGVTLGGAGGKSRPDGSTQPHVGDDVLIGAGAKILGPVNVGSRVIIGANAVVADDLPDDCVAVGVPARIVRLKGRKVAPPELESELNDDLKKILARLEIVERCLEKTGQGPPR